MTKNLAIKLRCPSISVKRIHRPRLIERLNQGLALGRQLTLVSAPAGFGKTSCISAWVAGSGFSTAWLTLDAADDDPGHFFEYFIAALQSIDHKIGGEIAGVLRGGHLPSSEIISSTLINDLLSHNTRFLLVLDDFQVIQDNFILEVLGALLNNPAPAMHLVLLTREDPPLALARLRANNRMTEIRATDLRFNSDESKTFLNKIMALELSEADIITLETRTEGWIVGLQLAAIAMQSSSTRQDPFSRSRFITALSGSHRFILSYLTEEVLNHQPQALQQFLLQTANLERLSADLCNSVCQRNDSQTLLARLIRANLFLIPLDDEEHWYRYHRLFADLLQELQKSQIPEQIAMLHQRASHWYEEQGMVNEAIQHALAGADYPTTVRIIEGNALSMLMEWHIKTVEGWMAAVPIEFCAESPLANLAFAWIHLLRGHPEHAFPYLERLQNMFSDPQFEGHADKTLKAKWFAMQCMLLNAQGKTSESINLGQEALKIAPTSDLHLHSMIHLGLAGAYQLMDDYQKATNAFKMILRNGQMANNIVTELLGLSGIALLAIQHGQLKLAFELATQAIERMENAGILPPISTGLFGELGTIYYQWYQLDQAHAYFQRAIQVSILSGYSDAELFYGVILSQLCLIENNIEGAAEAIQKSAALMQVEAPAAVREEVLSQQIRVYLAQDRLNSAEIVLTEFPKIIAGETFSFQGEFIYPPLENSQALPLTTQESLSKTLGKMYHCALRILLYRAVKKNEISNLKAGLDLANQLIDKALLHQYIPYALDTLLLRARIYAALGNNQAYLDDVRQALEMAAPEGIISVFVEEGEIIIKALAQINDQQLSGSIEPAYIKRILKASESSGKSGKSADKVIRESDLLIEPLSEREIDVLRLIAKGDTYNEIANQLYISVNTVRSHVKAIYDKMNVNNRTRAIEQASRMHIL